MRIKADTKEQYHLLEWIESEFIMSEIYIELLSENEIKIIDRNNEIMIVTYTEDGSISKRYRY